MIHKVGLLPLCNHQQVPFAYKMYTKTDELGWKQSNAFKKVFSNDVDIEFVGVWLVFKCSSPSLSDPSLISISTLFRDTVNSVGLIPRRLPFSTSNTVVCTFRHAVSLDERRAKFKANLWNRPEKKEELLSISDQKIALELHTIGKSQHKDSQRTFENNYAKSRAAPTDVLEVSKLFDN